MDRKDLSDMIFAALQDFDGNVCGVANIYSEELRKVADELRQAYPNTGGDIIRIADLMAAGALNLNLEQSFGSLSSEFVNGAVGDWLLILTLAQAKTVERLAFDIGVDMERVGALMGAVQTSSPTYKTLLFLKRVSRCYTLRLDSECITMSRAALEAEFTASISSDECCERFSEVRDRGEPMFTLYQRVLVARDSGRISIKAFDAANRVRDAANRILHRAPENKDAINVIKDCLSVIAELAPTSAS